MTKKEQMWNEYLQQIDDYLKNTPDEIKDAIWEEVLAKNTEGPTLTEYIQWLPPHLRPD